MDIFRRTCQCTEMDAGCNIRLSFLYDGRNRAISKMRKLLNRIKYRGCRREQETIKWSAKSHNLCFDEKQNPDQKLCKRVRVHKFGGEVSNKAEFLRLRNNSKQFDYFLGEKKKLSGPEVMAYEVKGDSLLEILLQE